MIEGAITARTLLVATDFDGTLAPIVDHPDDATAPPAAVRALEALAGLPRTWVAVVSGRSHSELASRFAQSAFRLIGEHGSDPGNAVEQTGEGLDSVRRLMESVADDLPGSRVEHKKGSVALHYRNAAQPEAALARIRRAAGEHPDLRVLDGKMVLEVSAADRDKGDAIRELAAELGTDVTLYLGDDVTDESVFRRLRPPHIGIKVGPGETSAAHRVASPMEVAVLLDRLARERAQSG